MHENQDMIFKPSVEPTMVCGRNITVDPVYIPQAIHNGNIVYFCTESCLNAFLADPEGFHCAHNKTALK